MNLERTTMINTDAVLHQVPKQLTQAVFKNAPEWVKSAAVDSDGTAIYYSRPKKDLEVKQLPDIWGFKPNTGSKYQQIGKGYDTTNWQHSAIDRE